MTKARWVLVGGETLLGKEVRELCEERKLPVRLALASPSEQERALTEGDDGALVTEPLDSDLFAGASALLLAGDAASSEAAMSVLAATGMRMPVIDLSGWLEARPEAKLRAPLLEGGEPVDGLAIQVVAHPASIALARVLRSLQGMGRIRSSVVSVFEPASARGSAGIDELHQQTVSLFAFQEMPKKVFDTQAAYNLSPRLGEEAPVSLASSQRRLEANLGALLRRAGIPRPSLRLIQAPVFHGYCQSVWVEFEVRPEAAGVEEQLREEGFDVRSADLEPASNVAVAGQSGITVSDVAEDPSNPHGLWLWMASDNLRTVADNAILVAAMFLQTEGRA
jgi:aspartate-semialdehyde dehydrogenase